MAWELELNGTILEDLYAWIDNIPLSKPKKKIERDFSDGTLAAEIVRYYLPDMISMKNYLPNSAIFQKKINWEMLNKKVFSRLAFIVPEAVIQDLSNGKPGTIERLLFNLRLKIDEELESRQKVQSQTTTSSPRQSLLSLNNVASIDDGKEGKSPLSKRTSRPVVVNPRDKWIPRLDYDDLNHKCLQFQEEIEILQARLRRLQHVVQLKEFRITELSNIIEEYRHPKPIAFVTGKYKKK